MKRRFDNISTPQWKLFDKLIHRIADWSIMLLGITSCILICRLTIINKFAFIIWSIVLCFYFFFYRRIAQVIFWSWDTLRLLKKQSIIYKNTDIPKKQLPMFHVLISSYEAGASLGPVIKALANQDYPKNQYHVWIITEHAEVLKINRQVQLLMQKVIDNNDYANDVRLLFLLWHCISQEQISLEGWITQITSGNLQGYLSCPHIWPLVLEDLFSLLLRVPDRKVIYSAGKLDPLRLKQKEIAIIENELQKIEKKLKKILNDFDRLLGSDKIYERNNLEILLIDKAIRNQKFEKIGIQLCNRLSSPAAKVTIPDREIIERAVVCLMPSTQEIIRQIIADLPCKNIHHLDPQNRGYKPGALNAAYRKLKEYGYFKDSENVFLIVIDSDSLLPVHALKTIAHEISKEDGDNAILQMASIPTANFFSEGWFSKFISFADAIGAVGKWARSIRRQLKPDLHAGSGIVIPAAIAQFIEEKAGSPWDESTITEDARLIIGQFGMMNKSSNRTIMAPVYLLEAVPGVETFWSTYKAFWNQRRRWTTGGYDEFFYMFYSPRWLRYSRFNRTSKRWEEYFPGIGDNIESRIKQLHRIALWFWDHFLWGSGGFIVLTHWWLISIAVAAPSSAILKIGLVLLLLSPVIFLSTSARQLSWFIPGGLSIRRMCLLYLQSFIAIWFYCFPVVVTQIVCILGFRSKYIKWYPTRKPKYQHGISLNVDDLL